MLRDNHERVHEALDNLTPANTRWNSTSASTSPSGRTSIRQPATLTTSWNETLIIEPGTGRSALSAPFLSRLLFGVFTQRPWASRKPAGDFPTGFVVVRQVLPYFSSTMR